MNRDKFWEEVNEEDRKIRVGEYKKRKNPLVAGTFYKSNEVTEESPGIIQVVENYEKREGVMDKEKVAENIAKQEILKVEAVRLEQVLEQRKEVVSRYKDAMEKIKVKPIAYLTREGERIAIQQAKEREKYNKQYHFLLEQLNTLNDLHEEKLDHYKDAMEKMTEKYKDMDKASQERLTIKQELLDEARTRVTKTSIDLEKVRKEERLSSPG